jgi:hypothetical protein
MADVLGVKRPHALLRHELLHSDHSKMLSKARRFVDMWYDDCESDILSDDGLRPQHSRPPLQNPSPLHGQCP